MAGETLDDRISELPDSLLLQILSLLPTEEAFTTCILSKRWQYLWTSLNSFIFSPKRYWERSKGFRSFVDYVLSHFTVSKIDKFELHCGSLYKHKSQISRWLTFAVKKNVQHVVIYSHPPYIMPQTFFTCSSLITLHIAKCSLVSDIVIAWKSLNTIKLEDMVVLDAEINNLLSGCPALETIVFNSVGGFSRLEINSLKHLELSRDFHDFMCCLVDVSSVVNAKITFDITCIKDFEDDYLDSDEEDEDSCRDYHEDFKTLVQDYLQKLRYATELTFGTLFSQVLCILQFKEVPIPELECKYLALELHLEKFSLYGAAGLLRASRLVETLNISIENQPTYCEIIFVTLVQFPLGWLVFSPGYILRLQFDDSRCSFERKYLVKGDSIGLQRYISSFVFSNLKNVKIVIFSGVCLKEHAKKLFKLSNLLLKNTVVLEKFVIVSNRQRCEICGIKCMPRFLSRLANKLGSSADL
ncbi:hypothetical protein KY285_001325 [Solanum tuberosum]|nr:hypothetical protein KY285_001325 [Solanum tuberosum]